jgi:Phage Tail Collar Domain
MSYVLSKSNGTTLLVLNDGIVDTAVSSITFIGKNVAGYGDAQNENFLHLLENFYSNIEPRSPIAGQVWYSTIDKLNRPMVFDGSNWRPMAVSAYSASPVDTLINGGGNNVAANKPGDFWFDSINKQLYVITGTNLETTLIGPESVSGFGVTKMVSTKMFDTTNAPHPVIQMTIDGEVVSIMSSATFVPSVSSSVVGFTKVNRGMTFKNYTSSTRYTTATSDVVFYGLHEQLDPSYPRRNVDEHIQANWYIDDSQTLKFGTAGDSSIGWGSNNLNINTTNGIKLQTASGNLTFVGTTLTPSSGISLGTNASVFADVYTVKLSAGSDAAYGTLEGNWNIPTNSSLTPAFDSQSTIGNASRRFNSVWTRNIGSGASTDLGTIVGNWKLSTSSSISPVIDLAATLGTVSSRYSTVYTTGISAGSSGTITVTGSSSVAGDIIPATNATFDLGDHTYQWNNVNAVTILSTTVNADQIDSTRINSTYVTANTATITNVKGTDVSFNRIIDRFFNAITQIDLDGTLAANVDARLSTQKAVKTYVDNTSIYIQGLINAAVSGLQTAIANIKTVPAGSIFYSAGSSVPSGYLACNGAGQSASVYPDLFAAIGYTYGGSGDLFYLPDLRGQFVRGWDLGRGIDSGRSLGSSQSAAVGPHQHDFTDMYAIVGDYGLGGSTASAYDRNGNYIYPSFYAGNATDGDYDNGYYGFPSRTDNTGVGMSGDTRPTNVALLPIIKV